MIRDFLGKDTAFPISNGFSPVEGIDTLLQDMQILLMTIPGERVNRPTYGCGLYTRIWDNLESAAALGVQDIRQAVEEFEPRVNLDNVNSTIDRESGTILFTISFTVISTNTPLNLVFPFTTQVA
jgi:phage baseplate assembly protein W